MKNIITIALACAIASLPFEVRPQEMQSPPEKQVGLPVIIAGAAIVCVAGAACYVVARITKKHDEKTLCKNEQCKKPVPLDAEWCPNCGTYFRCKECGTEFPKDAKKCPATWCGAAKPPPEPAPKNKVQYTSTTTAEQSKLSNGNQQIGIGNVTWKDVPEPYDITFASGPTIIYVETWEEFWELVNAEDILFYYQVSTNAQSQFFRIARQ